LVGEAAVVAAEDEAAAAAGGVRSGMHALTMAAMLRHWTAVTRRGLSHPYDTREEEGAGAVDGHGAMRAPSWTRTWMPFGRGCGRTWTVDRAYCAHC
jgi:hypothetical protein